MRLPCPSGMVLLIAGSLQSLPLPYYNVQDSYCLTHSRLGFISGTQVSVTV